MVNYILKRLIHSIFVIMAVLVVVFLIIYLSGDPAALALGTDCTEEEIADFRHQMGFDKPLYVQFLSFLQGIIFRLDFGISLRYNAPALPIVLERIPATLELTAAAMFIAILLGLPFGLISGLKRQSFLDVALRILAMIGQSAPIFWLGIMLMLLFALKLRIFPCSGSENGIMSLILPAVTLSTYSTASVTRLLRSSVLDTITQDYIRTARAKGLSEWVVTLKHLLRNCLLPVFTLVGLQFGTLLGGAVVTETIFAWPGVGRLVIQAIYNRDIFLVQAAVFIIAFLFIALNLLIDILYTLLDPRISITK